jgi:hypothetical protein
MSFEDCAADVMVLSAGTGDSGLVNFEFDFEFDFEFGHARVATFNGLGSYSSGQPSWTRDGSSPRAK